MPVNEHVLTVVRGWIEKAESDLKIAVIALKAGEDCPADAVAFHAHQCVEKYLKAFLVSSGTDFPKTHNIEELMARIPENFRPNLAEEEQDRLTEYATVTRYPGDYEPISLTEAREAVEIAQRIRDETRSLLPKETLVP
ncbi:HEPN domain-containing protein [Candidatus Bipolaricaulota bacterium]|nr:HEPN domain-containing protein [Candidatus Bipolaricaulota bacterium]